MNLPGFMDIFSQIQSMELKKGTETVKLEIILKQPVKGVGKVDIILYTDNVEQTAQELIEALKFIAEPVEG